MKHLKPYKTFESIESIISEDDTLKDIEEILLELNEDNKEMTAYASVTGFANFNQQHILYVSIENYHGVPFPWSQVKETVFRLLDFFKLNNIGLHSYYHILKEINIGNKYYFDVRTEPLTEEKIEKEMTDDTLLRSIRIEFYRKSEKTSEAYKVIDLDNDKNPNNRWKKISIVPEDTLKDIEDILLEINDNDNMKAVVTSQGFSIPDKQIYYVLIENDNNLIKYKWGTIKETVFRLLDFFELNNLEFHALRVDGGNQRKDLLSRLSDNQSMRYMRIDFYKRSEKITEELVWLRFDQGIINDIIDRGEFNEQDRNYLNSYSKTNKVVVALIYKYQELLEEHDSIARQMRNKLKIISTEKLLDKLKETVKGMRMIRNELKDISKFRKNDTELRRVQKELGWLFKTEKSV